MSLSSTSSLMRCRPVPTCGASALVEAIRAIDVTVGTGGLDQKRKRLHGHFSSNVKRWRGSFRPALGVQRDESRNHSTILLLLRWRGNSPGAGDDVCDGDAGQVIAYQARSRADNK